MNTPQKPSRPKANQPQIRILFYVHYEEGNLLALADVEIAGQVILPKLRLVRDKHNPKPRIQVAQHIWKDIYGERRYDALVRLRPPLRRAIQELMIARYDEYCELLRQRAIVTERALSGYREEAR